MRPEIDPTTDFVFKRLFGNETDRNLAIDLLNAVIAAPSPGKRVRSLTLRNPVEEREFAQDKQSIYDIRMHDQGARCYLLEMQRQGLWFFPKRALFYGSSEYSAQLRVGEEYLTLQPVFVVCFMVRGWDEKANWHRTYQLRERDGNGVVGDLELHFLDLSRFEIQPDEIRTGLQRWCYFLKHAMDLDTEALPGSLRTPVIHQAMEVLMHVRRNEDDYGFYTRERQREIERATWKHVSENAREIGLEEGIEIGEERGLEKGLEQGLEKGLEQGRKEGLAGRVRFAQRVLKQPLTPEAELLGLSLPDLAALVARLEQGFEADAGSPP